MTIIGPKEAAKYLQFSEIGLYKLLQENKIPGAFKVGNRWKIRKESLDEFIENALKVSMEKASVPSQG